MPDPAPETRLARALAQLLADNDLGDYRPAGPDYTAAEHGILIDRPMPTTFDNCTLITPQTPIADGRANILYRVQLFTRVKGTVTDIRAHAHAIFALLDHAERTPPILGISWTEEYSRMHFDADTQKRVAVAQNFSFRGRRGH
ncbi:hypothetical protein [Agromyces badenianii]|uniref:hypothetical protein n=1 Tax=Agromyces badenianii TaxID=2080742 RepID=UPI000D59AC0E|nr:hypothetical protein [Agromyces badenianii]PWC05409.1 hypothetical protein DCE94_03815 [Agromyces badenianii]